MNEGECKARVEELLDKAFRSRRWLVAVMEVGDQDTFSVVTCDFPKAAFDKAVAEFKERIYMLGLEGSGIPDVPPPLPRAERFPWMRQAVDAERALQEGSSDE